MRPKTKFSGERVSAQVLYHAFRSVAMCLLHTIDIPADYGYNNAETDELSENNMKNCSRCGKPLDDNERFCTVCGTDSMQTRESLAEEEARQESAFCASYKRILRYESRTFKIFGILYLVLTIALAIFTFVLMGSNDIEVPEELVMLLTNGEVELTSYLFSCTIYYCVISAVNMIISKRADSCCDAIETDISRTVRHYSSFFTLFLCIMFNNIALIFYIINFVKTRSNAVLIARIIAKQRTNKGDFTK